MVSERGSDGTRRVIAAHLTGSTSLFRKPTLGIFLFSFRLHPATRVASPVFHA